jgi:prepilin-type N-terminal cleavage/methylation domain-containing protein
MTGRRQAPAAPLLKGQRGFSLAEVLVAITLLSLGMLASTASSIHSIRTNHTNNNLATAVMVAQETLEGLKAEATLPAEGQSGINPMGQATRFTSTWVYEPNYDGFADLTKIVVTVTWTDYAQRAISLSSVRDG